MFINYGLIGYISTLGVSLIPPLGITVRQRNITVRHVRILIHVQKWTFVAYVNIINLQNLQGCGKLRTSVGNTGIKFTSKFWNL